MSKRIAAFVVALVLAALVAGCSSSSDSTSASSTKGASDGATERGGIAASDRTVPVGCAAGLDKWSEWGANHMGKKPTEEFYDWLSSCGDKQAQYKGMYLYTVGAAEIASQTVRHTPQQNLDLGHTICDRARSEGIANVTNSYSSNSDPATQTALMFAPTYFCPETVANDPSYSSTDITAMRNAPDLVAYLRQKNASGGN